MNNENLSTTENENITEGKLIILSKATAKIAGGAACMYGLLCTSKIIPTQFEKNVFLLFIFSSLFLFMISGADNEFKKITCFFHLVYSIAIFSFFLADIF